MGDGSKMLERECRRILHRHRTQVASRECHWKASHALRFFVKSGGGDYVTGKSDMASLTRSDQKQGDKLARCLGGTIGLGWFSKQLEIDASCSAAPWTPGSVHPAHQVGDPPIESIQKEKMNVAPLLQHYCERSADLGRWQRVLALIVRRQSASGHTEPKRCGGRKKAKKSGGDEGVGGMGEAHILWLRAWLNSDSKGEPGS